MAEPTNQPRIPPTNDAGSGKPPPPMPPPPSSLPEPDDDRMMRQFVEATKEIKVLLEQLKKTTSKEVYDAAAKTVIEATKERVDADEKHSAGLESLNKQYQEFMEVLEDGSIAWKQNTEFIQIEYQDKKAALDDARKKKENAEAEAKKKLADLDTSIQDMRRRISEMHREAFRASKEMERSNHPLKELAEEEYEDLVKMLEKGNQETSELVEETRRLALVNKRLIQFEAMALKQKKEFSELDRIRHKELIELYKKLGTEASAANAERMKGLIGGAKGDGKGKGIFNAMEIGKQLDELLEEQRKILREANPEKSDDEIAELLRQMIRKGEHQALLEAKVKEKYDREMHDLVEKEVEVVMREEKVSRQLATLIVRDMQKNKKTEFGREFHDLLVTQKKSLKVIKSMEAADTLALAAAEERDRRQLEIAAETRADTRLDEFMLLVQKGFFDLKGLLKPKDDKVGWFKWILRALLVAGVFAATAYIGFLWYKMKFIGSLLGSILGRIPKLAGLMEPIKRMGEAVGKIGRIAAAISAGHGALLRGPLATVIKVLMKVGGWIGVIYRFFTAGTGMLSILMRTIGIAWRFVGKLGPIFMAISIIIDAVRGAIKGYEKFGGIKGIVIGIVAGLVDWLTFGFLGLDNILDAFNATIQASNAIVVGLGKAMVGVMKAFYWIGFTLPKMIGEYALSLAQKTADFIAEGLVALWDTIYEPLKKFGEMLYAIPDMYIDFVKEQFEALGNIVSNISEWIMGVLSSGADMLSDAFSTLWNWISGGAILGGLKDLGTYLWDQISGMVVGWWDGIVGGIKKLMIRIGDALGKIPIIGSSLKKFFHGAGGGSDGGASTEMTGSASSLNRAVKSANSMVEDTNKMTGSIRNIRRETSKLTVETERTAMADRITRGASKLPTSNERLGGRDIQRANGNAENARLRATSSSQPIIINSPKTNVVNSRGDSGGGTVLMPAWSRNNDPTNSSMNMGNQPPT